MRWPYPRDCDRRTYTYFALCPRSFGGVTYWLERLTVTEVYFGYAGMWVTENLQPPEDKQDE